MKSFIIQKPGKIEMVELPPIQLQPDEALVRVSYAGICATDLAILSGDMTLVRNGSIRYPIRFGHEWSGVIESVGSNVTNFAPGDHVISESGVTCGTCEFCQKKQWSKCPNSRSLGTINCWDGAFSEYMHIPARHLYKVPENISIKEAALIEPTCIALAGIKKAEIQPGKTVLVIGTGAIGLASVALAKYYGADKILLCGRKDSKLAIGRIMGADVCINTVTESLEEIVLRETDGNGADAIIETSGNVSLIQEVLNLAANQGHIGLIGFYEKVVLNFKIDEVVMKSLVISGVMGEFGMPGEVLNILSTGKVDLKPMITHVIPFNETANVMNHISDYENKKIKILVKINEEQL